MAMRGRRVQELERLLNVEVRIVRTSRYWERKSMGASCSTAPLSIRMHFVRLMLKKSIFIAERMFKKPCIQYITTGLGAM